VESYVILRRKERVGHDLVSQPARAGQLLPLLEEYSAEKRRGQPMVNIAPLTGRLPGVAQLSRPSPRQENWRCRIDLPTLAIPGDALSPGTSIEARAGLRNSLTGKIKEVAGRSLVAMR
jgi:hypothetical protein